MRFRHRRVTYVGDAVDLLLSVKDRGCFFEGFALGFDEEEEDVAELEGEERAIDDVLVGNEEHQFKYKATEKEDHEGRGRTSFQPSLPIAMGFTN